MSIDTLPKPFSQLDKKDQICRNLQSGEALFVQGRATAGLYYLVAGTIDLKRATNAGHSVLIHRARYGDTFAEASLFCANYHCTATVVSDAQVLEFKRAAILNLFANNGEFATSMASRFASQIQDNRRRVELLSIRGADERVMEALIDGLLVEDIATFADTIGLAAETVYRSLARLTQNGKILKTQRGQYQYGPEHLIVKS